MPLSQPHLILASSGQPAQLSQLSSAISAQPALLKIVPKWYRSWIDPKSSQRSLFEGFCRCLLGCSQNLDLGVSQLSSAISAQPSQFSPRTSVISGQPSQLSHHSSASQAQPSQLIHLSSAQPAQLSHLSSAISAQSAQLFHLSSAISSQPSQPSQLSSASSAQKAQLKSCFQNCPCRLLVLVNYCKYIACSSYIPKSFRLKQ